MNTPTTHAFTLLELLVVIAIIGLLSSLIVAGVSDMRAKARDARRITDFKNVNLALALYYDTYNRYPPSPNQYGSGFCGPMDTHQVSFEAIAQTLVDEGFLSAVPKDPGAGCYMAFNYTIGLVLVAALEFIDSTTSGPYGSHRPFDNNWCSHTIPSTYYCFRHPH